MATGLTATVQPQYGRVLLQLTFTAVTSASVVRVHADGSTWPVRGAAPAPVVSTTGVGWVGYDHEAPLDSPVTYRATSTQDATVINSTAVTVASDPSWVGSMAWLTHPLQPALSRPVLVEALGPEASKSRSSVLPIVGRGDPVAVTDKRVSGTGELTVITTTHAETALLKALLDDGGVLCIRCPAAWGAMWCYATIGDATGEPLGSAQEQWREWKLPYSRCGRPDGDGSGAVGATWADAAAAYATWAALATGEPTWNDLAIKAGP